jgi:hypoxanthine phosphoribosyltransferase
LGSLIEYILGNKINNVLIVDDVKDTGGSLEKTVTSLSQFIKKIKTATIYYKPSKDKTHTSPNFYLYRTDKWIVFPHEIKGLKKHELKKKSEELHNILTT